MTTYKTKTVALLNRSLLPMHYDSWLSDVDRHIERATTYREVHIMPWNDHVVAEGIVDNDDMNLKRALRDCGVL